MKTRRAATGKQKTKKKRISRPRMLAGRRLGTRVAHTYAATYGTLLGRLEERYGFARVAEILEDVVRETFTYDRPATSKVTELEALRQKNAVSLAVLRAEVLGDALSSDAVTEIVRRSRPTVNKMAKEGALLAVPDGRALKFPRWQFDSSTEDGLVPGLREVLSVLDASPLRRAAWFIRKNGRLNDRRPVDVLRAGDVATVLSEAKSLSPA